MKYNNEKEALLTKEQMAATIAHEIKNPLALIRATLQYLELDDTQKPHKQKYDLMYREIDRLNELIVTYIESVSPNKLNIEYFAASKILDDVKRIFVETFNQKNIKLTVSDHENAQIKGDYNKIKQVLINVLSNATDAVADVSEPAIEINVTNKGGYTTIIVSDNGSGIICENLPLVGTPFFTTKKTGTGLGISISKQLVQLHNGDLRIKSSGFNGCTVVITIPY